MFVRPQQVVGDAFNNSYVFNGKVNGEVGDALRRVSFDPGLMRPYVDNDGITCCDVQTGEWVFNKKAGRKLPKTVKRKCRDLMGDGIWHPSWNATTMRKEDYLLLDRIPIKAARQRLRAWAAVASRNTFSGFDGMAKLILEHETMSDVGQAFQDMNALSEGTTDTPLFQLEGLPLPITHCSFTYDERALAVSRNSGTPLSTTTAEMAGRRVGELVEKVTIGTSTGVTAGGASTHVGGYGRNSTVYGMTNFTARNTKTDLNTPDGTNQDDIFTDVLEMRQQLYDDKMYGPYVLFHSDDYDTFLDNDYVHGDPASGLTSPTKTLRNHIREIEDISDVIRLDFLTDTFTMLLVQMTEDVIRAVIGMEMKTVQWDTRGGMQHNFMVMTIMAPQVRADYDGNCGLVHATTS